MSQLIGTETQHIVQPRIGPIDFQRLVQLTLLAQYAG